MPGKERKKKKYTHTHTLIYTCYNKFKICLNMKLECPHSHKQ